MSFSSGINRVAAEVITVLSKLLNLSAAAVDWCAVTAVPAVTCHFRTAVVTAGPSRPGRIWLRKMQGPLGAQLPLLQDDGGKSKAVSRRGTIQYRLYLHKVPHLVTAQKGRFACGKR